ncbi:MAG: hypothetical protein HKN07_10975 [Acidimicrobiia bacterium]|nr:hypothetical protein [Acidimicrobiia bacterium]
MKVRCGRCREPFDVGGPGRHACPMCGSMNAVGEAPVSAPPNAEAVERAAPAAGESAVPTRIDCPDCEFSFFVGDVAVAPCPNCRTDVVLRSEAEEAEPDV